MEQKGDLCGWNLQANMHGRRKVCSRSQQNGYEKESDRMAAIQQEHSLAQAKGIA
jgi:hypothetical protein